MDGGQRQDVPFVDGELLDAIPVALCIVSAAELKVLAHNTLYAELLEEPYRSQGAAGQCVAHVIAEAERQWWLEAFQRVSATGKPHALKQGYLRSAGGRWWEGHIAPLYDEQGRAFRHLITLLDVSPRVLAEQSAKQLTAAVQAANERLTLAALEAREGAEQACRARQEVLHRAAEMDAVFAAMVDAVLVYGTDGQVIKANPAAQSTFGFDPIGVARPELAARVRLRWLDGALVQAGQLPAPPPVGSPVIRGQRFRLSVGARDLIAQTSTTPLVVNSWVVGSVEVWRDITDHEELLRQLRQNTEELAEANRRKTEFFALLGHELRNPLAAITNAWQVLDQQSINGGAPPEKGQQLRAIMRRQLAQITRMMDDLLDISRITAGRLELRREWVDLVEVVRRAADAARSVLEAHRHELKLQLPEEQLLADVDPARIEQVLANLLHNAAKYTPPGGAITLTVALEGTQYVLRVQDNGIGIDPQLQQCIFQPFRQLDHSLASARGGLGLGLALVHSLVQLHGGSVTVRSSGEGRGSEFIVRLPAETPVTQPSLSAAQSPAKEKAATGRRVLIVEDQADLAETMGMLVELLGCQAEIVRSGEAAVEAIVERLPEIVLLDIGLPDIDGYEVARRVQERLPEALRPRLVAVTGYGQPGDRERAEAVGIHHHLIKPVEVETLREMLEG